MEFGRLRHVCGSGFFLRSKIPDVHWLTFVADRGAPPSSAEQMDSAMAGCVIATKFRIAHVLVTFAGTKVHKPIVATIDVLVIDLVGLCAVNQFPDHAMKKVMQTPSGYSE
jgi:hypothetical protein